MAKEVSAIARNVVTVLQLLLVLLLALEVPAGAQALPDRLRKALATHLSVSEAQLKKVEEGGIVTLSAETGNPTDIMLVGIARIWATPRTFVNSYRDIAAFEGSPGAIAGGKFSTPPRLADFKDLKFSNEEIDALKKCEPGHCSIKIDDASLLSLRRTVQWDSANYVEQASDVLRRSWLQYVTSYQKRGNAGLAVYHDASDYSSVEQGLNTLMAKATLLQEYSPHLMDYLRGYPRTPAGSTEDFFYWQAADFGMKPVHRITHVAIQSAPSDFGEAWVIGSKMLYASHYFGSALEVRYAIPGQDQRKGGMHYLIVAQRSYVDGMTGFRGRILRAIAVRRSRSSMERYLGDAKRKVELEFNRTPGSGSN